MPPVIQIDPHTLKEAEILTLLAGYRLLPQLRREILISKTVAAKECTPSEIATARQQFYSQHQIKSEADLHAWLNHYGMTYEQLEALAIRELKIEKFKQATWGHRLESHFLTHKSEFSLITYSIIRTSSLEIAQELFFRIQAGEQTFAECAKEYSTSSEAPNGGLVGPVPLSQLHPTIAKMLTETQPGQLLPPINLGEWYFILRLEKFFQAQLDEAMRQQLLSSLFETWLTEQLQGKLAHEL